jgi:hypothetical protein
MCTKFESIKQLANTDIQQSNESDSIQDRLNL